VAEPFASLRCIDKGFRGICATLSGGNRPRYETNHTTARIRIVVEHVLAGVKRCHIVRDVFRNTAVQFDDLVMEIACGLHNFRAMLRYAVLEEVPQASYSG
jgi:hypothetical protein